MTVVKFSNVLEEHIMIPWENRTNFDMFDVIRERNRVNKLWLVMIKQKLPRMKHTQKIKIGLKT